MTDAIKEDQPMEIPTENIKDEVNSDTSDDEEIEQIIKNTKHPKKQAADDMDTESVAFSTSTYKTKNEIDYNDIEQIKRFMPKMVDKEIGTINKLGKVENFIPPHTLFVKKQDDSNEILDLDNFVCNENRELIGYIDEVVGPINEPYYTVVFYPSHKDNLEKEELNIETLYKNKTVYFVEKTKKLVFWNNILNQKGCDASNMFDEEVCGKEDEEFSDDEQERAYKKVLKKVKNQRKRRKREEGKPSKFVNQAHPGPHPYSKKREVKSEHINTQYQAQPPYMYCPPPQYGQTMPMPYTPNSSYPSHPSMPPTAQHPAPYPAQAYYPQYQAPPPAPGSYHPPSNQPK